MRTLKQARQDDNFRQMIRQLGATPRPVAFTFDASLEWPEREWYKPTTIVEAAQQAAVRSRRAQGLDNLVTDGSVITKLATLLRGARHGR